VGTRQDQRVGWRGHPGHVRAGLTDFLNFVEMLSQRSGQRIDEDDYPKLATLASASAFVAGR